MKLHIETNLTRIQDLTWKNEVCTILWDGGRILIEIYHKIYYTWMSKFTFYRDDIYRQKIYCVYLHKFNNLQRITPKKKKTIATNWEKLSQHALSRWKSIDCYHNFPLWMSTDRRCIIKNIVRENPMVKPHNYKERVQLICILICLKLPHLQSFRNWQTYHKS